MEQDALTAAMEIIENFKHRSAEYFAGFAEAWVHGVVATPAHCAAADSSAARASAGVFQPSVLRGLPLRPAATRRRSSDPCTARSVPLGKYWRSRPLDAPMFVKRLRGRRRVGPLPRFFGRGVGLAPAFQ